MPELTQEQKKALALARARLAVRQSKPSSERVADAFSVGKFAPKEQELSPIQKSITQQNEISPIPTEELEKRETPRDAGFFESFYKKGKSFLTNTIPQTLETTALLDESPSLNDLKSSRGISTYDKFGVIPSNEDFSDPETLYTKAKTAADRANKGFLNAEEKELANKSLEILEEVRDKAPNADPEFIKDYFKVKYDQYLGKKSTERMAKINVQKKEAKEALKGIPQEFSDVEDIGSGAGLVGGIVGEGVMQIPLAVATRGMSSFIQERAGIYDEALETKANFLSEKYGTKISPEMVRSLGEDGDVQELANQFGLVSGALDMFAANQVASPITKKLATDKIKQELLKRGTTKGLQILGDVSKGTVSEGATGFIQDLNSQVASKMATGVSFGDAIATADYGRAFEAAGMEAIGGFGVGGGVSAVSSAKNAISQIDSDLETISTGNPALDIQQDVETQQVIDDITQNKPSEELTQEVPQDPVLEGVPDGRTEEEGQQVSPELRTEEAQEVNTEFVPSQESTVKGDIRESIRPSAPQVITNEYKLLKERIRNYARGVREGSQDAKKAFRGIGKELEAIVNTQQLPAKAQTRLLKRATAVNYNNPLQVERLFDYADKLVQDAAYVDKVEKAEATQSKLRGLVSNLPVEQKDAVKSLIKLDPENVDIDAYNSLLDEVAQAKKPVGKGFAVVPLQKVQDFVDRNAIELEEKIDVVVDEATKDAKEEDKKTILKPLFDVAKNNVSEAKGFTKVQKDVIDGLNKANFDKMSAEDMRRYIKVAENIAQNGSFGGSAEMAAKLAAEDVKLEKSYKQMNKFLQAASEQISTFAETLNDIAGWNKGASELAVKSGFSDMHKQLSQVDRANDEFKGRVDKEIKRLENKYKGRSVYDAESITTSSVWAELQQRRPDETEQEGFDRAKANIEKDLETKKNLYPDQYELEIKDWNTLGKAANLQEAEAIMKKAFPKEYELVEFVKKEFEPIADDTITTAETLFNKTAPRLINYTPVTTYRGEEKYQEPIEETEILLGTRNAPPKPKQGGSSRNRMLYLPDGFIRDRDFLGNIFTAHKRTLYDTKVAPEVLKVGQFLKSENARTALGVQNTNSLVRLFESQVRSQRGIGAEKNEFIKQANSILDGVSKIGFTRALGGLSTGITQAAPTIANTMVNLGGDMGIMFRLGTSLRNKGIRNAVSEIIKQNPIGQRLAKMGGVNIGEEVDVKTKGLIRKGLKDALRPVKEFKDKVYDGIMASFAYGDAKPAELAWISYYVKALKDQGIDVSGYTTDAFWNSELELQNTENRKLATAFAEQMINSNLNPSQSEQFAPILRANTFAGKLVKGGAFPLVSFKLNQSKRMAKAIARLVSKPNDEESWKVVGSIMAEVAAYIAAAELIAKPLINKPIEEAFRELFDMPDDREEDEEFQKRLLLTNIAQNVTPFMLNEWTTNTIMDVANRLQYSLSDSDEGFEKWKKDNGFITFEKKGLETYGIFGLGLAAPVQALDDAEILLNDGELETINPYTGDIQILDYSDNKDLIAFSGVVNLMSALGINFREIASANAKLRKQATREAKGTPTPSPLLQGLPNVQLPQPVMAQPLIQQPQIPVIR